VVRDTRFRDPNVPDGPGFMLGGDGTLTPIERPFGRKIERTPKLIQKMPKRGRGGLGSIFEKLQQQLRNQQQPQPLERVDMPSQPRMPTRESITNFVKENVDFSRLPRMMMAEGRDANIVDFLNADPEQVIFGIDVELDNLEKQLDQAQMNNDRDAIDMIGDEMNDLMFERIKLSNISGDEQRFDDYMSAVKDSIDMGRARLDESRRRASRMGPRSLTPEQQTRLMQMRSEAKDQRNLNMQMQQRDALDEFLQELEKKN